jgi:5-methylcytosine-specific restriction protein B
MANYFTSDHFKLLNKWKGTIYDKSNPEQQKVYEELSQAFDVTKRWAEAVQKTFFPMGWTKTVRKPTDQWQKKFIPYNWGRIYPSSESPKELAYTVGIDAVLGFVVKIDVVDTQTEDSAIRPKYEAIRGPFTASPIVAVLPATDGLAKAFSELVAWSVDSIAKFQLRYDDVVAQLDLGKSLSDEDLLKHFDGNPAFQTSRASWSPEERTEFCRLARAVHAAGLDWWHMGDGVEVRFGRKNPGAERAVGVLGRVRGTRTRTLSWARAVGDVQPLDRAHLTDALVDQVEDALAAHRSALDSWLGLELQRPALWPDQLRDDPTESGPEASEGIDADEERVRAPINRIYYGPPGTGKTYQVSKLLKREYEQAIAAVSMDDWRRQFIAERLGGLKWWEAAVAALYDRGTRGKVGDLAEHPFIKAVVAANGPNRNIRQTLWQTLNSHTVEDSATVRLKKRVAPGVFDKSADSVWYLAGDWRDTCEDLVRLVDELKDGHREAGAVQRYSFVTFHQSYGYEEFVEGLRPLLGGDTESSEIGYEVRSGVFKDLCRRARSAPDQRFAIVIDEINRGNISKIFGELITLIEPDKREGAENAVSVTLPYSGDSFAVPANVDIIGTMNTADRSLALLDTALRRRFEFVPVMPDSRDEPGAPLSGLRVSSGEQVIEVPRMLDAINERVAALYDRDHCIGHAYFTPLAQVPDGDERLVALQQVFSTRLLPLLEEYFFEDWQKIRLVLADNQKPEAAQFVCESADHEDDLARLFGGDHGLDSYTTKRRYAVQHAAFSNPDAYIGIYQTLSV